MKITFYDATKKKTASKEIKNIKLNEKERQALIHEVVRSVLAGKRSGTASTLTRSEVRGGGRKPWRQKGTGRARAGTIRSPLWKGGGVTFGPKPKDFSFPVPKKAKRISLMSAVSYKAKNDQLVVLDKFKVKTPKTKDAKSVLDQLKIDNKVTVVVTKEEIDIGKSFRNIPKVNVSFIESLNAYDVLDNKGIIFTKQAFDYLEEVSARC